MKAYLHLIKHALSEPDTFINVHDGEEWIACKRSYKEAKEAIEAVEEATVSVRRRNPKGSENKSTVLGRFLVIPFNDPEEAIADYTITEWSDSWNDAYEKTL